MILASFGLKYPPPTGRTVRAYGNAGATVDQVGYSTPPSWTLCPAGTGPGGTGTVVPGGGAGTASVPYTAVTRWFHPPVACSTVDAKVKHAGPILRGTPLANR